MEHLLHNIFNAIEMQKLLLDNVKKFELFIENNVVF